MYVYFIGNGVYSIRRGTIVSKSEQNIKQNEWNVIILVIYI